MTVVSDSRLLTQRSYLRQEGDDAINIVAGVQQRQSSTLPTFRWIWHRWGGPALYKLGRYGAASERVESTPVDDTSRVIDTHLPKRRVAGAKMSCSSSRC